MMRNRSKGEGVKCEGHKIRYCEFERQLCKGFKKASRIIRFVFQKGNYGFVVEYSKK
jgi:hypothetical protein